MEYADFHALVAYSFEVGFDMTIAIVHSLIAHLRKAFAVFAIEVLQDTSPRACCDGEIMLCEDVERFATRLTRGCHGAYGKVRDFISYSYRSVTQHLCSAPQGACDTDRT